MLIKENKKHINAFIAIMENCSSVRRYDVDKNKFMVVTFHNNGFSHDNMTQLLALLWSEHKGTLYLPLKGKYYAKLKPSIIGGKYAAYELILVSNDKRKNTCVYEEHYNSIGGFWYTPSHELGKTGQDALNSFRFDSLKTIVRAFNQSLYIR